MNIDFLKHIIKHVFCWILLLQIINVSIHPPHFIHPKSSVVVVGTGTSIEEINSVYELIAEGVFDKEVPETEEDEVDVSSLPFELYFFTAYCSTPPAMAFAIEHFSHYHTATPLVHQEPHSPPPKIIS